MEFSSGTRAGASRASILMPSFALPLSIPVEFPRLFPLSPFPPVHRYLVALLVGHICTYILQQSRLRLVRFAAPPGARRCSNVAAVLVLLVMLLLLLLLLLLPLPRSIDRSGAGLFHQIQLRAPLRNDETLYRLAGHQFAILVVSAMR